MFTEISPGCPVGCKYCMVTHIDSRRINWQKTHRWGINKTLLFLNRLPEEPPVKYFNINPNLLAGEYLGFQGITDPFWNIFSEDLLYMANLAHSSQIRKLILVTKWSATKKQLKVLEYCHKVYLVVSITGLDMIEGTTTNDRLQVIESALALGINTLPLIHPYIHGLSNISFLKDLHQMGIKEVAVKGFRYNDHWMGNWAKNLIPKAFLDEYLSNEEEEILIGNEYINETLQNNGLERIEFREWVHRSNGIQGIGYKESKNAVDQLFPQCVVSSSDPSQVYQSAIERRCRIL